LGEVSVSGGLYESCGGIVG